MNIYEPGDDPVTNDVFSTLSPAVQTGDEVEFDSLLRSTLSPKLNMFNSVNFVESGQQECQPNVERPFDIRSTLIFDKIYRVKSTLSPMCTGPNGYIRMPFCHCCL